MKHIAFLLFFISTVTLQAQEAKWYTDFDKAKKTIKAEWKTDTELESTEDHDKILKELLQDKEAKVLREDGNVDKAFAEADKILERTYEAPFLPH